MVPRVANDNIAQGVGIAHGDAFDLAAWSKLEAHCGQQERFPLDPPPPPANQLPSFPPASWRGLPRLLPVGARR